MNSNSAEVDERVVQMRFDNKEFERNVSTTMSTVDKLKQKLNFRGVAEGFDSISRSAKQVDVSPLARGIEEISVKFDAMQVMAISALTRITNKAIDTGERLTKSLSVDQINAGWSKYEQKTASVQTLVNSTGKSVEEINSYLNKLMWYSDETSYGFNDMVSALATMVSSGGDMDKLIPMIEGVANATAFAGKGAAEFSRIMQYSINQAYSLGYMQVQDWKSIEGATVNSKQLQEALIAAGESLGKFKKGEVTLANFRSSLAKKWLDKDVMEAGFGQFATVTEEIYKGVQDGTFENYADGLEKIGDKYGEVASRAAASSQEAKSFTEAIDATKDAVSSGWMRTFELIFGNYEQAKVLWTDLANALWDVFAAGGEIRNEILESALGKSFTDIFDKIKTGIKPLKDSVDSVKEVVTAVKDYATVVDEIISGQWGNGQKRWDKLTEAGYDWAHAQNLVNERLGCSVRHATDYKEVQEELEKSQEAVTESTAEYIARLAKSDTTQLTALGYSMEQVQAFRELAVAAEKTGIPLEELINNIDEIDGRYLLINSFKNLGDTMFDIAKAAKQARAEIFPPKSTEEKAKLIFNIIAAFHRYTKMISDVIYQNGEFTEKGNKLIRTLKGLFAIIDVIRTVVGGGLRIALKVVSSILGYFNLDILDVTAAVGDALVAFRDWINSMFNVSGILDKIGPKIEQIKNWLLSLGNLPGVKNLINVFKELKDYILFFDWSTLPGIKNALLTTLDSIASKIEKLTGIDIYGFLESTFAAITSFITTVVKNLTGIDLSDAGKHIFDGLAKGLEGGVSGVIDTIAQTASEIISKFCELLGIHSPSKVFIAIGGFIIAGLLLGLQNGLISVPDALQAIIDKCLAVIKNIDWGAVFAVGISVAGLVIVKKVTDILENFSAPFGALGDILKSIEYTIDAFNASFIKLTKAMSFNIKAKAIKQLAITVGILVACVLAIVKIGGDDYPAMWNAVGIIAVLSGILVALSVALNKLSAVSISLNKENGFNIDGIKSGLLSIAIAIGVLGMTVKLISTLNVPQAIQGFIGLIAILGVILGFIAILQKVTKANISENVDQLGSMVLKLSVGLLIMAGVCKIVGKLKSSELAKGIIFMGAFMTFVTILSKVSKKAKKGVAKIGSMVLKLSIAMALMVGVCKLASLLSVSEILKGALFAIAFANFVKLLVNGCKVGKDKTVAKLGGFLLGISVAMLSVIGVCKLVGMLSVDEMIKGSAFMLAFTVFVGILVKVTSVASDKQIAKVGGTIIAVAVAVGILAGISTLMSLVNTSSLAKGVVIVGMLAAMMAGLITALEFTKAVNKNVPKSLIVITVAISAMMIAVAALSLIDAKKLALSTASITTLVGIFSVMVKSLGALKGLGKVAGKLLLMTLIVTALGGLLAAMSLLSDGKRALANAAALSTLLLSLSGSIAILGLSGKGIDNAKKVLVPMLLVMLGLGTMLTVMSLLPVNKSLHNAIALSTLLLAFSASIVLLSASGRISSTVIKTIPYMILVVGALSALLSIMSLFNVQASMQNVLGLSTLLLAFSTSMILLSASGKISSTVMKAMPYMILVVGALAAILSIMSVLNVQTSMQNVLGLSTLLLAFSTSLVILSAAGKVSSTVIKTIPYMILVAGALAAMLSIMSLFNVQTSMQNVLGLSTLLLAFSASMIVLSLAGTISKSVQKALLPMVLVVAGLALILGLLAGLKLELSLNNALSLSTVLLALSAAVFIISYVGPGILLADKALVAMAALVAGLAVVLLALGGLSQIPGFNDIIKDGGETLAMIGYALGNFVGSIVGGFTAGAASGLPEIGLMLSQFMVNATPFITGLKIVDASTIAGAGMLAGAVVALTVAEFISGIASLISFGGSFADLGTELSKFIINATPFIIGSKIIDQSSIASIKMLVEAMMLVTAAEFLNGIASFITKGDIMEKFGKDGVAFFKAIKAIAPEAAGFEFPADFSMEGLKTLLSALKAVAGAMVGVSISDMFAKMAGDEGAMEKFGKDGVAFFKAIKVIAAEACEYSFPEDFSVDGLKMLLKVLKMTGTAMTSVSIADMFAKMAGDEGTMEKFQTDGVGFFTAIKAIAAEACEFSFPKDFSVDALERLFAVLRSVGEYTKDSSWNDILTLGGTSIEKFETDGVGLFTAIKNISTEAGLIQTDNLSVAENAIERIKAIIASVIGLDYSGVADFTGIGTGWPGADGPMHDIGKAIKDYADQIKGMDTEAVKTSVTAANSLRILVGNLVGVDYSGVENFNVKGIGTEMKDYNSEVKKISADNVASSVNSAINLASLIRSLVGLDSSGVSMFNPLPIGEKISAYSESIGAISEPQVNTSITCANSLKTFINGLAGLNTEGVQPFKTAIEDLGTIQVSAVVQTFSGAVSNLSSIGGQMITAVAKGMRDKESSLTLTSTMLMRTILTSMNNTTDRAKTVGETFMTNLDTGLKSKKDTVTKTVSDIVSDLVGKANESVSSFQMSGFILMGSFAGGLHDKHDTVISVVSSTISDAISSANSHYQAFYSAGANLVDGFANGINANMYKVAAKASAMASAAKEAAQSALKIHSPSRVFYGIGDYTGQGFVNALNDYAPTAYNSGSELADNARLGLTNALSQIQDTLDSDVQPTIRPILDLTDVKAGAASISTMFGSGVSVGTMSNIKAINSMMDGYNQNGSNADVIAAINELGTKLDNAGDSYVVNGITYDDGSTMANAVKDIIREARVERRR